MWVAVQCRVIAPSLLLTSCVGAAVLQVEWAKKGVNLSVEAWLVKLMVSETWRACWMLAMKEHVCGPA
jgi:hypothetical protein